MVLTDLGTFTGGGASFGQGINNSGQVTGQVIQIPVPAPCAGFGSVPAFRTTSTGTVSTGNNLGTLLANCCRNAIANGINDSGVVVGTSNTVLSATGLPNHAVIATGTTLVDIHPLDPNYPASNARAINSSGQIAGVVNQGTATGPPHAFRTPAGQSITLPQDLIGDLGGGVSQARGINDNGDVVGAANTGAAVIHAFLYTNNTMYDLNNLVGTLGTFLGAELITANGINSNLHIAVNGTRGPDARGFRLTPADVFTQLIIDILPQAVASGDFPLTRGQLASLLGKLANVKLSIQAGDYKAAINQLNAGIREINAQAKNGKMPPDVGAEITEVINTLIMALS